MCASDVHCNVLFQRRIGPKPRVAVVKAEQGVHLAHDLDNLDDLSVSKHESCPPASSGRTQTSRNWRTASVTPLLFTAESGRSTRTSGGCVCGDLSCLFLPFLGISGDFVSAALTFRHSFIHMCAGFAASMTCFRDTYSSWLVVRNSKSSIFCSASNCARSVPVATSCTHQVSLSRARHPVGSRIEPTCDPVSNQ